MAVEIRLVIRGIVGDLSHSSMHRRSCCPCLRLVRYTHSENLDCTHHSRSMTRHRSCWASRRRIVDHHRAWRVGVVAARQRHLCFPPYFPSIPPWPSRRPPSASAHCRSEFANRNTDPATTAAVDCNFPHSSLALATGLAFLLALSPPVPPSLSSAPLNRPLWPPVVL